MIHPIPTFVAFWPFYLGEHSKPATRALHIVGSTIGLACAALGIVLRAPLLVVIGFVAGYAFSWIAHFFVEHNRPASFRYPLWSFMADWKMWACALTGRLGRELERAGVARAVGRRG